jgi:magnesium chelatase family protein
MNNADLRTKSNITPEAEDLLNSAAKSLDLSARSYMRVVKVARTIADLDDSKQILAHHITESLQYRNQSPRIVV